MTLNITAVERRLGELSVRSVHTWSGPGQYGFDIIGPDLKEPFFEVTVMTNGTVIIDDTHELKAAQPGGHVFDEIVLGVLEATVPKDPVLRECLNVLGEPSLRALVGVHAARLRDEMLASLRRPTAN